MTRTVNSKQKAMSRECNEYSVSTTYHLPPIRLNGYTPREVRPKGSAGARRASLLTGYTLVELIVAIGLFSLVMLLASSSYLLMIGINRQTQGITTGINNLSFALSTMTRSIRTGTDYNCASSGDCVFGGTLFTFTDENGKSVTYTRGIQQGSNGQFGTITRNDQIITDSSVNIKSLIFYTFGTNPDDANQPHVIIIVSGEVSYAAGKVEEFTVETGATMRGSDL